MSDEFITSYSDTAEDILLRRALRDVNDGFYIDIGAYDPELESITKNFYDAGWTGINVEPNPYFFKRLVDQRKRDLNFDFAISDCVSELELSVIEDTGLTILDAQIASAHHKDTGFSIEKITVQSLPLRSLWEENVPAGREVHFLKIDVEGAEEQVIRGADWTKHRPWILMIEATLPRTDIQNYQGWEPMLLKAGYIYAYFDGFNRYYVATEKKELLAAFEIPLNVAIDKYIPFMAHLAEQRFQESALELERTEAERKIGCAALRELQEKHSRLETCMKNRPRPFWERVLFRSTGKPKKALRKLLFHTSGKPRGVFRKYIIRPDGLPRSALYMWMSSQTYQRLRAAAHFPSEASKSPRPTELSRRDREMMRRLLQSRKNLESDTK